MPHVRVRNLGEESVARLGLTLLPALAAVTGTPEDHFTLELVATTLFAKGKVVEGDPFCEVCWFDRGPERQAQVAGLITQHIQSVAPGKDVVVTFTVYQKSAYFENGLHF